MSNQVNKYQLVNANTAEVVKELVELTEREYRAKNYALGLNQSPLRYIKK